MRASQIILAAALVIVIASSSAFTGYTIGKAQVQGSMIEKFHKLREYGMQHPDQFKKMMDRRHEQIREKMAKLKEQDPKQYREILQSRIEWMESGLSELKKELADTAK